MRDDRLDTPMKRRRFRIPLPNRDAFGRTAEAIARFMGTPLFLLYMTAVVVIWVTLNILGVGIFAWDPYPFILLNLFFSVQASYSAPLILLAQNLQDDRDRVSFEQDRVTAERNLADTEFLAREIAALRVGLNEVATRDFVRSELRDLLEDLELDRAQSPEQRNAREQTTVSD